MAFDLNAIGGYGNGELGDVIDPQDTPWQSCAFTTWGGTTLTLKNVTYDDTVAENNDFSAWPAGTKVLLIVGTNDDEVASGIRQGKWGVFTITPQEYQYAGEGEYNLVVSLDRPFVAEDTGQTDGFLVKIAQYRNLTLNSGCTLSAVQSLSYVNGASGGFVALMCSETLTFNGGHIDLRGYFGRPNSGKTNQEEYGTLDTDKYAGWENSYTKDYLLLSGGDGLAFIVAKNIVVANASSRIGNPTTTGVAYCRGASDSSNRPEGVTNLGGSTIFMVAGSFTNFTPKLIAKYRTGTDAANASTGLGRCYIASNTKLPNDEGLYAYDNISNPSIVTDHLKIKDFGDGSNGDFNAENRSFSNYAAVTAYSKDRKTVTVKDMTTDGLVRFAVGSLVMIHAKQKTSANTAKAGRFYLARILGITGNDITLDTAAPYNTFNVWLGTYYVQIFTIPQFKNFKMVPPHGTNLIYLRYSSWKVDKGYGGIWAIAVSDTCDLRGIRLCPLPTPVGNNYLTGEPYGPDGLTHIGNAQDYDCLPIGQGLGSIFILAKNLKMNQQTRLGLGTSGAINSGALNEGDYNVAAFGGGGGTHGNIYWRSTGGGYRGADGYTVNRYRAAGGGYGGGGGQPDYNDPYHDSYLYPGGYGSNTNGLNTPGTFSNRPIPTQAGGLQGAHIMIIADTITGFNQHAISTGGQGGWRISSNPETHIADTTEGLNGTAGYGGGGAASVFREAEGGGQGGAGGYNGGGAGSNWRTLPRSYDDNGRNYGGGSSGWAFIYCNNAIDQDTDYTIDVLEH